MVKGDVAGRFDISMIYNGQREESRAGQHRAVTVTTGDAMPAPASCRHATEKDTLLLMWRRVACAAVMLLGLSCHRACQLQRRYKNGRQVIFYPGVGSRV